jgi:hypothetical protein
MHIARRVRGGYHLLRVGHLRGLVRGRRLPLVLLLLLLLLLLHGACSRGRRRQHRLPALRRCVLVGGGGVKVGCGGVGRGAWGGCSGEWCY